jgi:hypothetical protein
MTVEHLSFIATHKLLVVHWEVQIQAQFPATIFFIHSSMFSFNSACGQIISHIPTQHVCRSECQATTITHRYSFLHLYDVEMEHSGYLHSSRESHFIANQTAALTACSKGSKTIAS